MSLTEAQARELLERTARTGPVWPRDIELAAKAVHEGKQAVLLGGGSVLYVSEQAERQ